MLRRLCLAAVGVVAISMASPAALASPASTVMVSRSAIGAQPDGNASWPSASADGRYVAFSSWADNLVPNDTNNASDVFVRDLISGTTRIVSVASDGAQATDSSFTPSISADGDVVAFQSYANNLVPNDTEGHVDVFVHVMSTGQTIRVSQRPSGVGANDDSREPAVSANGKVVAFSSVATNLVSVPVNATGICCDIFVHTIANGANKLGDPMLNGQGASDSFLPVLSRTGRYVAFGSWGCFIAKDIPCLDESNVYELDMKTGDMALVSRAYSGKVGYGCGANPAISADGSVVAFISDGSNLVRGDTNEAYDIFVRDMATGVTQRASVTSKEQQTDGALGRVGISGDGELVTFESTSWNMVPDDGNTYQDIFVRDVKHGKTFRVSVSRNGGDPNFYSANPAISADGSTVAFESDASNLVTGDRDQTTDIFARLLG